MRAFLGRLLEGQVVGAEQQLIIRGLLALSLDTDGRPAVIRLASAGGRARLVLAIAAEDLDGRILRARALSRRLCGRGPRSVATDLLHITMKNDSSVESAPIHCSFVFCSWLCSIRFAHRPWNMTSVLRHAQADSGLPFARRDALGGGRSLHLRLVHAVGQGQTDRLRVHSRA